METAKDGVGLNLITAEIVDAAVTIHRVLGPGINEVVCEAILARELVLRGRGNQVRVTDHSDTRALCASATTQ